MFGLIIAVFAGMAHTMSSIFVRKTVYRSQESFTPVAASNIFGALIFLILGFVTGQTEALGRMSWAAFGYLVVGGVTHNIVGRFLLYEGIRLIGANRTMPIITVNILVTVLLGVLFLDEPLTVYLVLALPLVFIGIILISRTGSAEDRTSQGKQSLAKGLLVTIVAVLAYGISPYLIKLGLKEINSALMGSFISYFSASIVIGLFFIHPANRDKVCHLKRSCFAPLGLAVLSNSTATLLRYVAIGYSPISLVAPLIYSVNALMVFPLSFAINRRIEAFDPRIIGGAIAIIGGVLLIMLTA